MTTQNKHFICVLLTLLSTAISCRKDNVGPEEEAYIEFSTENLNIDWEGGERTVLVVTEYDWHLLPTDESWIVVNREGDSQITLSAKKNETLADRSIKVPIICNGTRYHITVRQSAMDYIDIKSEKNIIIEANGGQIECKVEANIRYDVVVSNDDEDWVFKESKDNSLTNLKNDLLSPNTRTVVFNVIANDKKDSRRAVIFFKALYSELQDSVVICQNPANQGGGTEIDGAGIADGTAYRLQDSEYDNLNLVVMGDGFLKEHLSSGGLYEISMKQAIEAFFSISPYSEYRELFNVYLVGVESDTDVIGNKNDFGSVSRTKLGTAFGSGTEIVCNEDAVFEYASKAVTITDTRTALIIVVLNSDKYAGTCYMYINGNAIALCPMSKNPPPYDFESVVHHEAGGHGFGFLADEYVYNQSKIPSNNVQEIKEWQEYGYLLNLDFTSDLSQILWKEFVGLSDYPEVGAYEGGSLYQYGVWRSEENSCMNNNIPYYNIQSRWMIYKRIHELAEQQYSILDFLSVDNKTEKQFAQHAQEVVLHSFVPLGNPKLIKSRE